MPRPAPPASLGALRRRPSGLGRAWRRGLAMLAVALCAGVTRAAEPADLTELSLEQLMAVELPPASTTTRFVVSATAVESCIVSAGDLAFGTYDPLQPSATDGDSLVTVTCTVDTGYTIGLDAGTGAGATTMARAMTGAEHALRYMLYQDPNGARVWGESAGSDTVDGIGTGMPTEYTVYGRIPPGQPVRRGLFVDTVTVTVSY